MPGGKIMATHKVDGFNNKEQKVFNRLLDGEPHDIRELKKLFWKDAEAHCKEVWEKPGEHEVNGQAQSYVRNSLRRLIRDGWVKKSARGTYKLTPAGKSRVEKGVSVTKSKTESQRGKGGGRKATKKAAPKKAAPKKAAPKKKAATKAKAKGKKAAPKKKAATKAKAKGNGVSKKKVSTDKEKKMKAKAKQTAMKEKIEAQQAEAN
jgi:hypothetical protein